jgi:acetamidase/formamidase
MTEPFLVHLKIDDGWATSEQIPGVRIPGGFTRNQAYVICSVAVDLRVSNVVDVPNYVVSALLPEAIFG